MTTIARKQDLRPWKGIYNEGGRSKNQTRIINILLELEREIKKLLQANNLSMSVETTAKRPYQRTRSS
jgi:hypothetical protein